MPPHPGPDAGTGVLQCLRSYEVAYFHGAHNVMLSLIYDPACAEYAHSYHPETPARVLATAKSLQTRWPDVSVQRPGLASEVDLLRAHRPGHLARLLTPPDFDGDTPWSPGIGDHARRAAGGALLASREALRGKQAFSLLRPPGHHATADRAMGFCYLNSVAIAALAALVQGCTRVGIWDFDAHHGNGTEAIVQGHSAIRFASVHQYPGYPGTGTRSAGNAHNWPVPPRTDRGKHAAAVRAALDVLLAFKPDLLLVSAGFDAFVHDPITDMSLELEDFYSFGTWLGQSGVPAAAILEGGYSGELGTLVQAFLEGWEG
ncbi:MAG TPA: histone deacetylase [Chthoniobacterales bacterium]